MSNVETTNGHGLELSIAAKIAATLETVGEQLARSNRDARRLADLVVQAGLLLPTSVKLGAVLTVDANGDGVLDHGGPAQGRVWDLRSWVVGRLQVDQAAAGTAYLFSTAAGPAQIPVAVGLVDLVDRASPMPLMGFYGAGDVVVRYPEKLYVWFDGGTASVQYSSGIRVVDRLETPTTRATVDV